jgi:putative tricarboxylic transport membrane protein
MWGNLLAGFGYALQPPSLAAIFGGMLIGYFVGAMPGLNPTLGISLLIPFTFGMKPVPAIILLTCLYMACEYGGGITAILINTPGTSAAAATALDGYPLSLQGKAGKALGISILSSGVGSFFSTALLIVFAIPLARFALSFGGPEYFALALFGLSVISGLSAEKPLKGWISAVMGLLFSCVGMDSIDGASRYAVHLYLLEGLPFVAVMIGLFAISEVFILLENGKKSREDFAGKVDALPTREEMRSCRATVLRGTLIGFIIGVIPAAGANIASWVSYNDSKRRSRTPEAFGKGALEGIAASESANNSAVSGALVPLLTLGIPGSSAAAVLIGALTIQGLQPGPLLFTRHPEIPYSIFAAFLIAAPFMTLFGLTCSKFFARVSSVPDEILAFCVFSVCVLGTYAVGNSIFHVWIALSFGVLGYFMKKFGFPTAPMVLAIVLGPMAETNFRLGMLMGEGNFSIFFTRPISLAIVFVSLLSLVTPLIKRRIERKKLS